jgi:hypothetical protein
VRVQVPPWAPTTYMTLDNPSEQIQIQPLETDTVPSIGKITEIELPNPNPYDSSYLAYVRTTEIGLGKLIVETVKS